MTNNFFFLLSETADQDKVGAKKVCFEQHNPEVLHLFLCKGYHKHKKVLWIFEHNLKPYGTEQPKIAQYCIYIWNGDTNLNHAFSFKVHGTVFPWQNLKIQLLSLQNKTKPDRKHVKIENEHNFTLWYWLTNNLFSNMKKNL